MAKEKELIIDETGFQQALQEQKKRSLKDAVISQGDWQMVKSAVPLRFAGCDQW